MVTSKHFLIHLTKISSKEYYYLFNIFFYILGYMNQRMDIIKYNQARDSQYSIPSG